MEIRFDRRKAMPWAVAAGIAIAVTLYLYPPWKTTSARLLDLDMARTRQQLASRPLNHAKRLELARYYLNWGLMVAAKEEPYEEVSTDTALKDYFEKRLDEWESAGEDVSSLRGVLDSNPSLFREEFVAREKNLSRKMFDQSVLFFLQARALGAAFTPRDLYDLGTAYYQMGPEGYAGAVRYLGEAIDAGLISTRALTFLGNVEIARGKTDRAVQLYRNALDYSPEDPVLAFNLGLAYKERNEFRHAAEYFRRSLRLFQDRENLSEEELTIILQARLALGWSLLQMREYAEAEHELETMIEAQPDSLEANYWLGVAYEAQGRLDAARSHWQRVIEMEPEFRDTRSRMERLAAAR